nr:hypothetical protein [Tanacetum cinerariifolium]
MIVFFLYKKYRCDGIVTIPLKWPAIRNSTSKDATNREIFEMCQEKFGLVDVSKENEETENESEVEIQILKEIIYETIEAKFKSVLKEKRELEDMLKENIEMHELFYEDEKFELFVKKFKEEFTTDYAGHCNDEDDVGHANHGDVHANGNDEKKKEANEATKKKKEAKKLAAKKKKKAEKLAAAKKKAEMQKATAEKKAQAKMQAAPRGKVER